MSLFLAMSSKSQAQSETGIKANFYKKWPFPFSPLPLCPFLSGWMIMAHLVFAVQINARSICHTFHDFNIPEKTFKKQSRYAIAHNT